MNSVASMWTYLPIFLPQDFLRDSLIGTITYSTSWNARYELEELLAESPKRQEASLPIIHPLPISPRYRAIFSTTISSFCRPSVRCGRLSSWNSGKSRSLLSPSFQPILRGHLLRSFVPSIHPTGVSCYGARVPLHLYWSLVMEQETSSLNLLH